MIQDSDINVQDVRCDRVKLFKSHIQNSIYCRINTDDTTYSVRWLAIEWEQHRCSEAKRFLCHLCHRKYSRKTSLNEHLRIAHKIGKSFTCNKCERKFTCEKDVTSHKKKCHDASLPVKCPICTYRFQMAINLVCHLGQNVCKPKAHQTLELIFSCDECDATLTDKNDLDEHNKLTHDPSLPFMCYNCTYRFLTKDCLETHISQRVCKPKIHQASTKQSKNDSIGMDISASRSDENIAISCTFVINNLLQQSTKTNHRR